MLLLSADFFFKTNFFSSKNSFRNTVRVSNSFDPDQDQLSVGPDLGPDCLQKLAAEGKHPRDPDPESFIRGGPTLAIFFYLMKGERFQIALKTGHHRHTREMAFRWLADDGPTLNAGLVAL